MKTQKEIDNEIEQEKEYPLFDNKGFCPSARYAGGTSKYLCECVEPHKCRGVKASTLKKAKDHAFNKDVYFLGVDEHGDKLWLEAASWACDWYWGFGYVEAYRGNGEPCNAPDISSHSHYKDVLFTFNDRNDRNEYLYKLSDAGIISPLTGSEQWRLSELLKTFYILKETAGLHHGGTGGVAANPCSEILKDEERCTHINKVLLPAIFEEVYRLLSPAE